MHRVEAVAMLSSGAGSEETHRHRANRKRSGCKMKHPEFKKFEGREGQPWNSKEAWKAWRCLNEKHDAEPRRRRAETGIWHCGSGPRIHLSTHFNGAIPAPGLHMCCVFQKIRLMMSTGFLHDYHSKFKIAPGSS